MTAFVDLFGTILAAIVGLIFIGGFVTLIATEIRNELKARVKLDESNEKKRKSKLKEA
jgi:hypothetical protein